MKQRTRIRFAKLGDLRLISHRDLVRTFERLFRRTGVSLAMSQGFHPRPRMTFPDALALGIAAEDEVMEIALAEAVAPELLKQRLNASAPNGLEIVDVCVLADQERKAKVEKVVYEMTVPDAVDRQQLKVAIEDLLATDTLLASRKDKQIELDLNETLEGLWLEDGLLFMTIRTVQQSQLQPRDILAAIGLHDVLREGALLTRTKVELSK